MNRTEIERLAGMANRLRPDWPWKSLVTFIEVNLTDRAYRDTAVALAYVACDPQTHTPKRVLEAGPWWQVGAAAADRPRPSGIVTYCEHGEPGSGCLDCHPRTHSGVTMSDTQRATIRAQIAEGRAHLEATRLDRKDTPS